MYMKSCVCSVPKPVRPQKYRFTFPNMTVQCSLPFTELNTFTSTVSLFHMHAIHATYKRIVCAFTHIYVHIYIYSGKYTSHTSLRFLFAISLRLSMLLFPNGH